MKSKSKHRSLETFINDLLDVTNTRSKKERKMLELYNIKQTLYHSRQSLPAIQSAMLRLAYIAMTGNPIDFGLEKIIILLNSKKFQSIRIGWLAFIIFNITDEISLRPIIQILQQQLLSYENEAIQCLSLSVVSQVFSRMILDVVGPVVVQIAVSPKTSENARKKALIISGKVYQITREPHLISVLAPALSIYLGYGSHSIRMATATLTVNLMSLQPGAFSDVFEKVLDQLYQLYNSSNNDMGFTNFENNDAVINEDYEGTPSPWYSRQLIRILRYKSNWDFQELSKIDAVAMALFNRTGEKLSIRPALAYFIVFSEMASLLSMIPIPEHTIVRCAKTLVRYLENDRGTMIYFALNSLNRLFHTNPRIGSSISDCLDTLYKLIHNDDSEVCMNSLNLLVNLSTEENSKEIVEKLIQFLPSSPLFIRKHLCSVISNLAKKANDPIFYVDTIVELLFEEGDECDDSTWQTAVSLVDEDKSLQNHTIDLTLNLMKKALRPSEQLMKLTVYVAGEYVSEKVNRIVSFIQARFPLQSPQVQAMMVTAMAKVSIRFPAFLNQCQNFLRYCTASPLIEVSDRAKQYSTMLDIMPLHAHLLLKRMPNDMGEDILSKMLDTVRGVARGDEEGVSTFTFDENEARMMPIESNEQLIQNFLLIGSGYIFHDMFLRVHLELDYKPPIVSSLLSFENAEQLPLTEITVQIVTNEDILHKASPFPAFIEQRSVVDVNIDFLLVNVTSCFPVLNVAFKCGGISHLSQVAIPLSFQRVVQSVKINPDSFKTQWSALSNPNLTAEIPIPVTSLDPASSEFNHADEEEEEANLNGKQDIQNVIDVARAEIELVLRSRLGLEPNYDLELPDCFIGGCGVYRVRKGPIVLMVIIEYNPQKSPNFAVCRIKSNNEKGLREAVGQLIPQQQQMMQMQMQFDPSLQNQ